jgi:hypothetical protein
MSLPEGFGHIPGRSTAKAIKLLGIADELGLAPSVIRGVTGGYDVPTDVLEKYQDAIANEGETDAVVPTTADQSFQRIETNHTPLTFDTTHEQEPSSYDDSVSASAEQTGVGFETSLAAGERTDVLPTRRTTEEKHELAGEGAPAVDAKGSKPAVVDSEAEALKKAADEQRAQDEAAEEARKVEVARREALSPEERAAEDAAAAKGDDDKGDETPADETPADDAPEVEKPAGNASQADWLAYAKSKGFDGPDDTGRDDLRDRYNA